MIVRLYKNGDVYYAWDESLNKMLAYDTHKRNVILSAVEYADIIFVDSSFKKVEVQK